jgi:hypothetical protein
VAQIEAAGEILKLSGDMTPGKIYQACEQLAAVQCLDVLMEDGEASLRKALAKNPACYLTLLNSICNLANSGLRFDQHRLRAELAAALDQLINYQLIVPLRRAPPFPLKSSQLKVNQARHTRSSARNCLFFAICLVRKNRFK